VFREAQETSPPILSVDPRLEAEQIARLQAFRGARDAGETRDALAKLEAGAREDRNLMPLLIEAVSRRSTLGEIVATLKGVYGEYRPGN
jgi:methylmalonyl-CoA mutase N-terminal domain/subunit